MSESHHLANRVFLAFKDMRYAWSYLEGFEALVDKSPDQNTTAFANLVEAVLIATVVTYCRPFLKSNSTGFADRKLDPKQIGLFEGMDHLQVLHDRLLTLRDQAIAHSDWTHHSTQVHEATDKSVLRGSPRPQFLAGLKAEDLRPLVSHVLDYCRNKSFDLDRGVNGF